MEIGGGRDDTISKVAVDRRKRSISQERSGHTRLEEASTGGHSHDSRRDGGRKQGRGGRRQPTWANEARRTIRSAKLTPPRGISEGIKKPVDTANGADMGVVMGRARIKFGCQTDGD